MDIDDSSVSNSDECANRRPEPGTYQALILELTDALRDLVEISELTCGIGFMGLEIPSHADGPLPRAIALLNRIDTGTASAR